MSLVDDNNFDEIRIINTSSRYIEIISLIMALADEVKYKYKSVWIKKFKENLSEDSVGFLDKLSQFRNKGLEMIEFLLVLDKFNDIEQIMDTVRSFSKIQYLYRFFGEEMEVKDIERIVNREIEIEVYIEDKPWIRKNSLEALNYIFFNTVEFREKMESLIKEINNDVFNKKIDKLNEEYLSGINEVKEKLKKKIPIDVAQDIIGKQFRRVYDFTKHIFIPSYFIYPPNIRFFNSNTQITIYTIRHEEVENDVDELASSLKIISDKTRLEILKILAVEPSYGKALAKEMNLSAATISHHLEQLKAIGLVNEERIKNIKYYSTNPNNLKVLLNRIFKIVLVK